MEYDLVLALEARNLRAVTPQQCGLRGASDLKHFEYAAGHGLLLLTKNPRDFRPLHLASGSTAEAPRHGGILAVHQDNIRGKDMTPAEIADALVALIESGVPITGEWHVLNHWRR